MRRPRFTYANVASSLALFIALGGVSWAAATLPKNSVGSTQLKKNAVTTSKIKDGQVRVADLGAKAVTSAKLADGAVGGGKLADGSVSTGKLADGAVSGGKLADGSVSGGKLADGSVNGAKIADGSVSGTDIATGTITPANLGGDLVARSVAAYASIDGFGPTIQQPYNKNVLSVTRNGGPGRYCLNVDWTAAGRNPAQQATPVIVTARSITQNAAGDVYNPSCPNNGVSISLNTTATATAADGWVHVLIP